MKYIINNKFIYLVLSLNFLWVIIRQLCLHYYIPDIINNSIAISLVIRSILFFIFLLLFLKVKFNINKSYFKPRVFINIIVLFSSFCITLEYTTTVGVLTDFIILFILLYIVSLIVLLFIKKPTVATKHIVGNSEYQIKKVIQSYSQLYKTMLIVTILIFACDTLEFTIVFEENLNQEYFYKSHVFKNGIFVIITSLFLYLIHEKSRHYIERLKSQNQVIFSYTFVIFNLYFLLFHVFQFLVFKGSFYTLFQYIAITMVFIVFVWFYFRKGNQLKECGKSINHMAYSSLLYCTSGGLVLGGLIYLSQILNEVLYNSELYATLLISLGILLFLLNQKLSKYFSS